MLTPTLPGVEAAVHKWREKISIRTRDGKRWTLRCHLVQSEAALARVRDRLFLCQDLVYDSETSGLNPHMGASICGHALGAQTGPYEFTAWYVPVRHLFTTEVQLPTQAVNEVVRAIMRASGTVYGHHLKFDVSMLRADDIRVYRKWHDTAIMAIIGDENAPTFKLKVLGDKHGYKGARHEEEELTDWLRRDARKLGMRYKNRKSGEEDLTYLERFGYARAPVRLVGMYACRDVFLTWLLKLAFDWAPRDYPRLYNREMGLAYYLHEMEWEGTPVDEAEIRSSWKVLHEEVEYWLTQVRHYSGDPTFQIKDSQLRELFYVRLGMEAPKVTEDGKFSVDQESRHLLRAQYPAHEKLIDAVNHHARTKKIESTYAVNFLRHVTPEGKIHASYNQLERREQGSGIPVTGRLSSANPNMQNIAKKPIHLRHCGCKKCAEEYGRDYGVEQSVSVRRYFTVPPGMVRAFVDLSQIELRTLAWFSQDPVLLHCYANDMDVHQITADECTGGNRDIAKQVNFGNSYGMTEVGLAKRLPYYWENPKQAIADAGDYLRKFFQTYAGIIRFRDRLAAEMRANGNMFVSPFGRPRRIPTIASNDERERSRAERMMMSSIISGTAADLMKEIMLRSGAMLAAEHPEVRIVQSIHDEVVYDMPIEGCAEVLPKIMKCFTDWPMFEARGVPIRASCELSTTTWEEKRTLLLDPDGFRWA